MKLLTKDANVRCSHKGKVQVQASQSYVTIEGVPVLVMGDLAGKAILACTNAASSPCATTLPPVGDSTLVFIDGKPVSLDRNVGLTSGVGGYKVEDPAQKLVETDQ